MQSGEATSRNRTPHRSAVSTAASAPLHHSLPEEHRRQQMVALLLSQIYARAERLRMQRTPQDTTTQLSLIELIDASYSVFERYGIGPPEDAEYHRYLLSLSIDPERDWRKKIERFTANDQPRIKRLMRFGGRTRASTSSTALAPAAIATAARTGRETRNTLSNLYQHQGPTPPSSPERRRKSASDRNFSRRGGAAGKPVKPLASSRFPRPSQPKAEPASVSSSPHDDRKKSRDHFSDMLAFPPDHSSAQHAPAPRDKIRASLKENAIRNAVRPATAADDPPRRHRFKPPVDGSYASRSRQQRPPATMHSYNEITADLTLAEELEQQREEQDDEDSDRYEDLARQMQDLEHRKAAFAATAKMHENFHTLSTTFETWKALHAVKQIVKQHQLQEIRARQIAMPAVCTHALFHWVVATLPEQYTFQTQCQALPTSVLRRISHLPTENLPALRHFTHRLWRWTLRKIVETWRLDARKKRNLRTKVMLRQRTQVLDIAFQCFQQWVLFKEMHKCVHAKRAWLTQRRGRNHLRRCLSHWQMCLHHVQRARFAGEHRDRRLLGRVLAGWKQSIAMDRSALHFHERNARSRAIRQWRQFAASQRLAEDAARTASRHYHAVLFLLCWRKWRTHTQQVCKLNAKLAYWRRKSSRKDKQRAFQSWKRLLSTNQELRELQQRFAKRQRWRQLESVFSIWATWRERRRVNTLTVIDAIEKLHDKLLKQVLARWKAYFSHARKCEEALAVRIRKLETQTRWHAWRKATRARRAMHSLQKLHHRHVMRISVSLWSTFVQRKLRNCESVAIARHCRVLRILRACWQAFSENVRIKRAVQHAVIQLIARKSNSHAHHCLRRWKAFVQVKRDIKRQSGRVTHGIRRTRMLCAAWQTWRIAFQEKTSMQLAENLVETLYRRRAFGSWRRSWRRKQQQRGQFARTVEQLDMYRMRRTLARWTALVRASKELRNTHQRCVHKRSEDVLDKAWHLWRNAYIKRCKQHTQVTSALHKWQHQRIQSAFLKWKTRWRLRRDHRRLVADMLVASTQKATATPFRVWQKRWVVKRKQRHATQDAAANLELRRLKRGIRVWRQRAQSRRNSARVLMNCVSLWRQTTLETHFRQWKALHEANRRLLGLFTRANAHRHHHLRRRVLTIWIEWQQTQAHLRSKAARALLHMQRSKMVTALAKLRAAATESKQLKAIHVSVALLSAQGAVAASFSRWKGFVLKQHKRRAGHTEKAKHMQRYRLQRSVTRWEQHARIKKLVRNAFRKATTFSHAMRLQRAFTGWTLYLEKRRFYKRLTQKALVFQVFSMLPRHFRSWQRFVRARKRKQTLLLRASGMLCHQRECKAFLSWAAFAVESRHKKRALTRWRNHLRLRCFTTWRHFACHCTQQKRDAERAVAFRHRRVGRKAFVAWRKGARSCKLLQHFAAHWRATASRTCFGAWVRTVQLRRVARMLLLRIQNHVVLRVFHAWKRRIHHEMHQIHAIRLRLALLGQAALTRKSWISWKAFAMQHRRLKVTQKQQQRKWSANMLSAWRAYIATRKRTGGFARQLAHQAELSCTRTYWNHWRRRQQLRAAADRMRTRAIGKRQRALLQKISNSWQRFAKRSRCVLQRRRAKQREVLVLVFHHGWCAFVDKKRQQKAQLRHLKQLHGCFLNEWLAQQIETRMETISVCEDVTRTSIRQKLLATTWHAWTLHHRHKQQQLLAIRRLQKQLPPLSSSYHDREDHVAPCGASGSMVKCTLVRWRCLPLTKTFLQWVAVASTQREQRDKTVVALEKWRSAHLVRSLARWRAFCVAAKRKRVLLRFYVASKTRRFWQIWRTYVSDAQQQTSLALHARTHWHQRTYRLCFTTWKQWSLQMRSQRSLVLQLYSITCVRLVRALFKIWTQFAVSKRTKRMQTTVALVLYDGKLVRTSWQTWRAHTLLSQCHRKQLQANTERLQVLLLCSTFRGWQTWTTQKRKVATIARILSSKCDTKTASRILHAWQQYAHKKLHLRHTASTFERLKALHKGVSGMKHSVGTKKQQRTATHKAKLFLSIMREQQVASCFLRWQRFSVMRRKKRRATRHFVQRKLLPAFWHAWRSVVERQKRRADRLAHAAFAWRHAFVRKAWHALRWHQNRSIQRRESIALADSHHRSWTVRAAVTHWRQRTSHAHELQDASRKILIRWKLQALYRCFSNWSGVARHGKELRRCHSAVMKTCEDLLRLRSWGLWRKRFVVERTGSKKCMQRYWRRWCAFREDTRMLTDFQHAIASTYLLSTQARMLHQWKRFVVDNKMRNAMALLSAGFASTQVAKRAFANWRTFAGKNRADKGKIQAVLLRMQFHKQFMVLRALHVHARTSKRKKKLADRVANFHSTKLQTRSFCEWKHAISTTKCRRDRLAHYVHVLQHSVQRKTLWTWKEFAETRKQLKVKVAKALALQTQLCSRAVWTAWTMYAAKSRKSRIARGFWDSHVSKRALQRWHKFVVLCKVEKMLGASHKRNLETCFVAWRKLVARNHNVRAFQQKTRQKLHLQQRGACFQNWKHRSHIQRRCKQILCSAANGNHLRFRFLLWKQFTAHSTRLKRMIVPFDLIANSSRKAALDVRDASGSRRERTSGDGDFEGDSVQQQHDNELASIAAALARKARFFQRFEIEWGLEQTWQRWRHIFHARLFYRIRKLHFHFVGWQSWSANCKRTRWVVSRCRAQRTARSTLHAFHGWKDVVQRVKQLQQQRIRDRELWTIVNTEMVRKERQCLKAHWKAWKFYVDEKRHLQSSLETYHRARIVTKYWLLWTHDFIRVMRDARTRSLVQRLHMLRFQQRRALQRLRGYQEWSKRVRLVLEYFHNKDYDTRLPQILGCWKRVIDRTKQLRQLAGAMQQRQVSAAFETWKRRGRAQRQLRTRVLVLMARKKQVETGSVWQRWCRYVAQRRTKSEATYRGLRHFVRVCLRKHWYRRVQDRKAQQLTTTRASGALLNIKMRRCIRRWRDHSKNTRLRRLYRRFCLRKHLTAWRWHVKNEIAHRFEHFMLRVRVKKVLQEWRQLATMFIYWRRLGAEMSRDRGKRLARVVWTQWLLLVHRARRSQAARQHLRLRLQVKSLNTWYQSTQCSKSERQEQTDQARRHFRFALRRRMWKSWRSAMQNQQKKRFSLLSCMVKLTSLSSQRMVEVVWHSWRRWADRERQCRTLQSEVECSFRKKVLASWQQRTVQKQRRKQQKREAERYYSNRLVSVLFFYWQNYALAWKDVTEANKKQRPMPRNEPAQQPRLPKADAGVGAKGGASGGEDGDASSEHDDYIVSGRRPLSPVMKRLRKKNQAATDELTTEDGRARGTQQAEHASGERSITPSFSEAAELSMSVKKRLMVLGKWNPRQKSLLPR